MGITLVAPGHVLGDLVLPARIAVPTLEDPDTASTLEKSNPIRRVLRNIQNRPLGRAALRAVAGPSGTPGDPLLAESSFEYPSTFRPRADARFVTVRARSICRSGVAKERVCRMPLAPAINASSMRSRVAGPRMNHNQGLSLSRSEFTFHLSAGWCRCPRMDRVGAVQRSSPGGWGVSHASNR